MFKPAYLLGAALVLAAVCSAPAMAEGPDGMARPPRPSFNNIDTNQDGMISPAEFNAFRPKAPDGPPDHRFQRRGPPDLKALDANGDGKVTFDEFTAPMKDRFDQMDGNHDGGLDQNELTPRDDRPPPR